MPWPLVLDGGVGHLLKTQRGDPAFLGGALRAARDPAAVSSVHAAFIAAGADVVTAASFGVTPDSLEAAGLAASELEGLVAACVEAARAAAGEATSRRVSVAAPLPPLGRCYESYCVDEATQRVAVAVYRRIAAAALGAGADVLLVETAACARDAAAAVAGALAAGADVDRVWVSWTVRDDDGGVTRGGDGLAAAVAAATAAAGGVAPAVVAVNCAAPAAIEAGVRVLASTGASTVGAYANAFRATTGGWLAAGGGRRAPLPPPAGPPAVVPPAEFAAAARAWLAAGARVVGGCCGAGVEHTAAVRGVVDDFVAERGHS